VKDWLRRTGEKRLSESRTVIGVVLALFILIGIVAGCGAETPSAGEHDNFYVDEVTLPDSRVVYCVTDYVELLSCVE